MAVEHSLCKGLHHASGSPAAHKAPGRPVLPNLRCSPERQRILVVDVRDDDYAGKGGHIAGCVHFSVDNFDEKHLIDDFIRQRLVGSGVESVIVHCYLCEQRGPFCANR